LPTITQRRFRKEPVSRYFLTPTFQLIDDVDSLEYRVLRGEHFPRESPLKSEGVAWAWVRYFHSNNEHIYIPKSSEYLNEEILAAALNGKLIDTSNEHVRKIDAWDLKALEKKPLQNKTSN